MTIQQILPYQVTVFLESLARLFIHINDDSVLIAHSDSTVHLFCPFVHHYSISKFIYLKLDLLQYLICCSRIVCHIVPSIFAPFLHQLSIGKHCIQQLLQFLVVLHSESSLMFDKLHSLHKLLIARTKNHRNAIDGSFESVVNTSMETTTDI